MKILPNKTCVWLPVHNKAKLMTPGCGEGKCSIYYRMPSKEFRTGNA